MVSLLNDRERNNGECLDEPAKPIGETWSGDRLLPTSRCIALDVDGKPGADVKVIVWLYVMAGWVRGRVSAVKAIDEQNGDVSEFRRTHRREAIKKALDMV